MTSLDLSLDTLDLHLASIESADLNSLPTSIFAPTELPAWSKMDLPNTSRTIESEPIFLEDFKWDGLDHLLNSKPAVHDANNTRVSVFERFDLGKISDDELSLFGEGGGNNRFSFYVGKVSPPKVNTLSLMKSNAAPAPITTTSSKTLSQMTQGNTDKENRSTSTNTAPSKSESPKQPEVSKSATLKKASKSTPTRNSLSGLPSGLPASANIRNSPRHSISRIPSSSSPTVNTAKKPTSTEKAPAQPKAPMSQAPVASQPAAPSNGTALKKPCTFQPSNPPARTISPTPSTQAPPSQPPATSQSNTGIPAPSATQIKKPVKKSTDIPKAAASVPQKSQAQVPTSVQPIAAPQTASAAPVTPQPADAKDPIAQLLARVSMLEDTITTMKKEHKQEVSALRTRLTLVEQKLQAATEST